MARNVAAEKSAVPLVVLTQRVGAARVAAVVHR